VILEDPGDMLLGDEALPEEILPDWKEMVEADRAQGREALIASARSERHPGWTDLDYGLWAESKLLVDPDVVDILRGEGFGNAVETYPRISAPTLILKADAEGERREVHRQLASSLVNGRLVHIDGAGHVIRNDRPEETELEIRRFLAGLSYDPEG
jgi:pimeloyl-ACP methyl ester carboxylesterase